MQIRVVTKILGSLLILFSITMIPPLIVSLVYEDNELWSFIYAFFLILLAGSLFWLPAMHTKTTLKLRDGFIVVVMFWLVLSTFGSLPLLLSEAINLSITDAIFESVSGLTTTGATIISNIDDLPKSILFYRQYLQWLGGLGIIVLAIAILPILGIGGMHLYKAEVAGPLKNKLTPRITETAKALWAIYLFMTIACAISYKFFGMSWFDAISHSFSTIAIGGFSTHNESFAYFNSSSIELVAIFFMIIAGLNYSLHYLALKNKSLMIYRNDKECNYYIYIIIFVTAISLLYLHKLFGDLGYEESVNSIFQTVSIITTTGYVNSEYSVFSGFLPIFLILFSFIGGCAGSTAGGMKVIRFTLLIKQGYRELTKLIHPNAKIKVKVGKNLVNERTIEAVWGFFTIYIFVFVTIMLVLMFSGLDFYTSFSAVAATINNLGPGLGEVHNNYTNLTDLNKWALCLSMIIGRLEIFTLLVILTPEFWRK